MRQHPIQNVLDVEFKLFTKFTLRSLYLAIGVSVGDSFSTTHLRAVPAVVGIPLCHIFRYRGILCFSTYNDQPADKVISNFFTAINRPTQSMVKQYSKEPENKASIAQRPLSNRGSQDTY